MVLKIACQTVDIIPQTISDFLTLSSQHKTEEASGVSEGINTSDV